MGGDIGSMEGCRESRQMSDVKSTGRVNGGTEDHSGFVIPPGLIVNRHWLGKAYCDMSILQVGGGMSPRWKR